MGSLRDVATQFERLGVTVYGCSLDDVASQAKFALREKLPYELLSDPDASAAKKYGVFSGRFAKRVTFVLDGQGVVRHVTEKVKVGSHGTDMLELIRDLKQ